MIDPDDRSTSLLFGDAGSATALECDPGAAASHFVLGSDGKGAAHIAMAGGGFREAEGAQTLMMNGTEVFGFTLGTVPALLRSVLEQAKQESSAVDILALHQANRFMLRHITKKSGIDPARAPINIDRFGNTSSASIPLLLCTERETALTGSVQSIVLAGFGVGLSWGAAFLRTGALDCAELIR